jgi:hypothetical protein
MAHKRRFRQVGPVTPAAAPPEIEQASVERAVGGNRPDNIPDTLVDACFDGRCVLFIGSGASILANGPSWQRLLEDVAARFSPVNLERVAKYFSSNNPWGAADLVCINAPRPELDTFVRNRLEHLEPSAAHLVLPKLPWAAIYTTNFDTLIEKAYGKRAGDRVQNPAPVYQFSKDFNLHDNHKVHILKLHGSIDQIHQRENVLVLTTKDETDTYRVRSAMLEHIPRLLLDYYWVFIGYGFADGILRRLLAELKHSNRDSMPRESFAILPAPTEEDRDLLDQYNIRIIGGKFEKVMADLDSVREREARGRLRVRHINGAIISGGVQVEFPTSTRVAMDDQFEIVQPARSNVDAKGFFLGGEPSWGNLEARIDFRRHDVIDEIKRRAREALSEAPLRALIVLGAAGSGKSTTIRRVAYELATDHHDPVPAIVLREFYASGNRYTEPWDVRLVAELAKAAGKKPVLIVVDNVEVRYRSVRNLYAALRERDVPATILGAARALDWSNITDEYPLSGFRAVELPDEIEPDQLDPFVRYLDRRGLVTIDSVTTLSYWEQTIARRHEHHLLGVMRSLSTSTEEAFDDKIISEYHNLPDLARKAYETICLVFQFGFAIPSDLLLMALKCSHPVFGEEVLQKDKEHVIIQTVQTLSGRFALQARHRIIAEIIAKHRWPNTYELCDAVTTLFGYMNGQAEDDYRLCRSLVMNDELRSRFAQITYMRRIFDTVLKIFPDDDVLYQHYAIAEMSTNQNPDFQRAHDLLGRALLCKGADRNPTIQHTRGMLYLRQAAHAPDLGRKKLYEQKAEGEFVAYRRKDRGSEYGYYSHAKMLQRQRNDVLDSDRPDENEASRLLAKALQIVREGLEAVDEIDLARLPLMEADLLKAVSPKEAVAKLNNWIRVSPTPDAFYLRAALLMTMFRMPDAKADIQAGLKIAPDHRGLLILQVKLLKDMGGYDTNQLLDAVRLAMLHAPDSPRLAFEAAVTAFHLNQLKAASDYFRRAYAIAGRAGKPRAFFVKTSQYIELHQALESLARKFGKERTLPKPSEPHLEEISGVLQGTDQVSALLRDGYGDLIYVRVQDLAPWMRPGVRVTSNVAFNYFGPLAINIRRRN